MLRRNLTLAAVSAVIANSGTALANGRFPYANQLVVSPVDPGTVTVRTTFGLLVSADHGKNFSWVCEQIIGFTNGSDPGVGVFADGSVAVAGFFGLAISHDGQCSFPFVGGQLEKQYVVDVAVDRANKSRGVAVTATQTAGRSYIQVFETADSGRSWAPVGSVLDPELIATNIDVAASRASRLYVSGSFVDDGGRHGFVASSDDRGGTWSRVLVDDVTAVYLSGVDPTNEDRVYARAYSPLADELLVSDDGARSFRSVLKLEGGMWGFALSPDGAKVAVGGPTQGTFVAARDALQFERRSLEPVTCLTWDDSGFYGCGAPKVSSFVVGQSQDEGRSWLPLLGKLTDIQGPSAACAPDSPSATTCTGVWPAQQAVWLVQPDAGSKADGSSEADSGTVPPGPPNRNDAGCGVLYAPSGPIGGMAVAAALGALALRRIRPRRGRGAPTRRSETR